MSVPRFSVRKAKVKAGHGWRVGWAVYDRDDRISVTFENYDEAVQRRDNIHALYLRYGW
jgi:hypothetical protein